MSCQERPLAVRARAWSREPPQAQGPSRLYSVRCGRRGRPVIVRYVYNRTGSRQVRARADRVSSVQPFAPAMLCRIGPYLIKAAPLRGTAPGPARAGLRPFGPTRRDGPGIVITGAA